MRLKKFLINEFVTGKQWFDWAFLLFGLGLQVVAIILGYINGTPDGFWLIISGLTGTVSVILCSQQKISFYFFGYIQLLTYVFAFSIPNALHGETIENVMYFITMLYGMRVWYKGYKTNTESNAVEFQAKKLSVKGNIITFSIFVIGTFLYGLFLKNVPMFGVLDSDPWVDSLTSVPAYIAQILMVTGYREQWMYWMILDVGSIFLAIRAGSWVMAAQFIFWTLNCVYGYIKWSKSTKTQYIVCKN